jgi:hypothetical protein
VTDDTAFIRLERDLGRLEGVVESLVRGIQMDRDAASAQRRELYAYIEASNDRNEKVVRALSDQIAALVQSDRDIESDHARRDGAWGVSRWTFAAMISLIGLVFAYAGYQQGSHDGASYGRPRPPAAAPRAH